ncbi:MAG TPA: guanylate kinase [Gammaproteobacteria bacterium]|nr:guanylate kinase [Gammaproteobacteria bacterium]HQZ88282.1 guanylate kinase [Gammaproteobacteria bacterium]HRA43140.1 guanylate kinase [Gammaproteobacteria bacterium]
MKGSLFIVAAPSGAGKTTLVNALAKTLSDVSISVSYTTRKMRPQEQEGVDYHFVSLDKFKTMLKQGDFLEHAKVYGHFYGTSRLSVFDVLRQGLDVILEIDWQGAKQVRTQFFETKSIFILPPSLEILEARLQKRHSDNALIVKERMNEAREQISHYKEFDYLVFNDKFEDALEDLKSIVRSQRVYWRRSAALRAATITSLTS